MTIQGGRLDTLAFDYRVRDRRVRGGLTVVYAGLAVGFVDPETGGRGLAEHLRGFLAGLELNRENLPREGAAYRTGEIAVELEPDDTFFKALWLAVRSGLMDVAGLRAGRGLPPSAVRERDSTGRAWRRPSRRPRMRA